MFRSGPCAGGDRRTCGLPKLRVAPVMNKRYEITTTGHPRAHARADSRARYAALCDQSSHGTFRLTNLPPGHFALKAWLNSKTTLPALMLAHPLLHLLQQACFQLRSAQKPPAPYRLPLARRIPPAPLLHHLRKSSPPHRVFNGNYSFPSKSYLSLHNRAGLPEYTPSNVRR